METSGMSKKVDFDLSLPGNQEIFERTREEEGFCDHPRNKIYPFCRNKKQIGMYCSICREIYSEARIDAFVAKIEQRIKDASPLYSMIHPKRKMPWPWYRRLWAWVKYHVFRRTPPLTKSNLETITQNNHEK